MWVGWLVVAFCLLARASLANDVQSLATYVASTKNVQVSCVKLVCKLLADELQHEYVVHFSATRTCCSFFCNTNSSGMKSTNSFVRTCNSIELCIFVQLDRVARF